jgi:hypothetical protein
MMTGAGGDAREPSGAGEGGSAGEGWVVTGLGAALGAARTAPAEAAGGGEGGARAALVEGAGADPSPWLKVKKSRKFMGLQDELAVAAAGRALASAGLGGVALGERAGLYLAVGYIPFEASDIDPVLRGSLDDEGRFSMPRFSGDGVHRAHPLLTFRCLPNMPAYHVSVNFDVQGPYIVSYPGPGQLYLALDEAEAALRRGDIDVALVLGVTHQRNFLVEHHFARLEPPVEPQLLRDAAACLVIEPASRAAARGAAVRVFPDGHSVAYEPGDSLLPLIESFSGGAAEPPGEAGPASLPLRLWLEVHAPPAAPSSATGPRARVGHQLRSRDGIRAESAWVIP